MAGLAAANSLCSAETNFQVTILEASNQVGGRTRSVAMGTQLVDVGATNMYYSPGRDEGDPLVEYALSRGLVEQIVEAGQIQTCVSDKPPLYLLSSGEKLPTNIVTHVMIVACYHPLPLFACMLHFDLVFWHFNPYILQHFSENVFTLVSLVFTVCSNTYKPTDFRAEFYLPCIPISRISMGCHLS